MKRGILCAGAVYAFQIPFLIGCVVGLIPVHPIVAFLPLVGLLNGKVEGRGREGLGQELPGLRLQQQEGPQRCRHPALQNASPLMGYQ